MPDAVQLAAMEAAMKERRDKLVETQTEEMIQEIKEAVEGKMQAIEEESLKAERLKKLKKLMDVEQLTTLDPPEILTFIQETNIGGAHRVIVQEPDDFASSKWGDENEIVTVEVRGRKFCSVGSLFQGPLPKVFEIKNIEYVTRRS